MAEAGSSGYVKFYRSLIDHKFWLEGDFDKGKAWADLLVRARWQDGTQTIGKHQFEVKRGQFCGSVKELARRWKWSRNRVYRFLEELEKEGMAEHHNNVVTSLITITNFEQYQGDGTPLADGTPPTPKTEHLWFEKRNTTSLLGGNELEAKSEKTEQVQTKKRNTTNAKNGTPPMYIEKNIKKNNTYTCSFEKFWKAYPPRNGMRTGKQLAFKSWKKYNCEEIVDDIIESVKTLALTEGWRKENGQYIPMPATFLNNYGWEIEVVGKRPLDPHAHKPTILQVAVLMRIIPIDYPDHIDRMGDYVDGELPIPTVIMDHIEEELK